MDILLKSIVGGIMVACILIISKLFGEKLAGVVATMPINLTIGFIILTNSGAKSKEVLSGFLWGMIPLTVFVLVMLLASKYNLSTFKHLLIGYSAWFISFFTMRFFVKF